MSKSVFSRVLCMTDSVTARVKYFITLFNSSESDTAKLAQ